MVTPLEELRLALTTIDRENVEATPGQWEVYSDGIFSDDSATYFLGEMGLPEDATLVVSAVAVYRGVVRDIIADAIRAWRLPWPEEEWENARHALRIARDINSRTEGAGRV